MWSYASLYIGFIGSDVLSSSQSFMRLLQISVMYSVPNRKNTNIRMLESRRYHINWCNKNKSWKYWLFALVYSSVSILSLTPDNYTKEHRTVSRRLIQTPGGSFWHAKIIICGWYNAEWRRNDSDADHFWEAQWPIIGEVTKHTPGIWAKALNICPQATTGH